MSFRKIVHRCLSVLLGVEVPRPPDNTPNEVGLPHLLKDQPEKLYEWTHEQILQMTEMLNANVIYAREIKNTMFFTSGAFLTVALPVIVANQPSSLNYTLFYIASLMLFVSLFIGVFSSLAEQKFEHARIYCRRSEFESASMCVLTKEIDRSLALLNANRSNRLTGKQFWKFYVIITAKDISIALFVLGVTCVFLSALLK